MTSSMTLLPFRVPQVYSHLAALVLADYLDADIVLPPSLYRQSFDKHFSTLPGENEVEWSASPIGALLDVKPIRQHFAKQGTGFNCM